MEIYRTILKGELARRCDKNPRYSLRSFANSLSIDPGTVSKILSGKQIPSLKIAARISKSLALAPAVQKTFVESVVTKQQSRNLERARPLQNIDFDEDQAELTLDLYRIISDFHHFAILELTFVDDFKPTALWVAKQLDISATEAQLAIDRLLKFGLLKKSGNTLVKTNAQLISQNKDITDPALKKNQRQFLERAIESLENDPIDERSMTSMTMAIDPLKLPVAKKMISEFNRNLCRFLESGKRKRVYNLEIALYPIQKKKKN